MRKLWIVVALAPLAACVSPEMAGDYMRVATINNVRLDEVPGTAGVYQASVKATADGNGWSDPILRVVPSEAGHHNEITLALYARAPYHAMRHNYDPSRASDGDTYPDGDDARTRGTHAVDTYFGHGGTPLEAKLVITPGSDDRVVRVVGKANDVAAPVGDLKHANAELEIRPAAFGDFNQNVTLIEVGPRGSLVRWNGMPLAGKAELDSRLAALSGDADRAGVRIVPDHDASPKQLAEVMRSLRRYGVGVRRIDMADRGRDRDDEIGIHHTDVAPTPTDGFWFPKLDR